MAEPLQLPPPLEGDISLRTLGRLAGRLDSINLEVRGAGALVAGPEEIKPVRRR